MVTRAGYSEQRRVWTLRLTVITTATAAAIGWGLRVVWASWLSTTNWLFVIAGLAIALLALSTIRLIAEVRDDRLTVRLFRIRLAEVQFDTVSSITAVNWPPPRGLTRWVLDGVMPPGGVQMTTATGQRHFVASDEPDRLAELIRTHL